MLHPNNKRQLEKYSSAFTLSDMEIFIFPELLYSLVLANILSPEIWKWRDDPWFSGIHKMNPLKKLHRVKQYIMDHYNFNLDLETWGLTDKQTEIERFRAFVDIEMLSKSNALFGYEGDKYYFDMDIRKHFGLDQYDTDIIPYWKTETIEAMNAFRFKPEHNSGAGECVSLACLYAAALFIVAEIPLENIYLLGTPLHSQNFVLIDEGVLTNNRRIVTKSMWYNGTELSALARRALEHEQVTIVAHPSGYIHSMYPEATIDPAAFQQFKTAISRFLETTVTYEIFINFLRDYSKHQKLFQVAYPCRGFMKYISLDKAFSYEHGSKNRLSEKSGRKLLCEMEAEDFYLQPMDGRFILDSEDEIFNECTYLEFLDRVKLRYPKLGEHDEFLHDFKKFVHTIPRLPNPSQVTFTSPAHQLTSSPMHTRDEIFSMLHKVRHANPVADLTFYAGRWMEHCDWKPFFKAAFERNPVAIDFFKDQNLSEAYTLLYSWANESIYEGNRLALPDEVVNYQRGDGIEKAITFIHLAKKRGIADRIKVKQCDSEIVVSIGQDSFPFFTTKNLNLAKQYNF